MISEPNPKLFEEERHETDESLIAERAIATRSLDTANVKSQDQTDETVKDERSIADQKTATSRAVHDVDRDAHIGTPASASAKAHLKEERRRADVAIGIERSKIDEAILAERASAAKLVTKVLVQERIATDKNLLAERNSTDAEFAGSSDLFKTEVTEHEKTRVQLTSRDEFLAIVSHDLRNPVGAISSYGELLLEGSSDTKLGPEAEQFVRAMKRNADISLRLIEDLLDLERISAGKLVMHFAICSANDLVSAAVDTFARSAKEKSIRLNVDLPSTSLDVECDHDRILQVVSNLVGNALKFTPAGGKVTIAVQDDMTSVRFIVRDTGPGIPEDRRTQIFERFAQLNSNDRMGLGLGLYIAKTIVAEHGSDIKVQSELGKGSSFYFSIPKSRSLPR